MKTTAEYRASARQALSGNWGQAILVGLLAVILGGVNAGGGISISVPAMPESIATLPSEELLVALFISFIIMLFALALVVAYIFLGGVISTGYAKYNLALIDGEKAGFNHLFGFFPRWTTLGVSALLRTIYVTLWTLLFVVPGIYATYNYAMTSYILAEDPTVGPNEAIAISKDMMYGHRWELFCLQFSFIGWDLLCLLSCGIGYLWLIPYKQAAIADFYREISDTRPTEEYEDTIMPESESTDSAS